MDYWVDLKPLIFRILKQKIALIPSSRQVRQFLFNRFSRRSFAFINPTKGRNVR